MKKTFVVAVLAGMLALPASAWAVSDCCSPHGGPGCEDEAVEQCVCEQDQWCCSDDWDFQCAQEVEEFGCGTCPSGEGCGDWACNNGETCWTCENDCGGCVGECCEANGTPGCWEPAVMACVCAMDGYCCDTIWDEACAAEVVQYGCDTCPGQQPFCGDGMCSPGEDCDTCEMDCGECQGEGDCCQPNGTPGCGDAGIQACVCAQDDFCCTGEWDEVCVELVEQLGCGQCGGPGDCGNGSCDAGEHCVNCANDCGSCQGDCCQPNGTPACANVGIATCVCAQDDYCCTTEWDEVCVGLVEEAGCGQCGGPVQCGNGSCDDGEHCANCAEDCGWCEGDCCEPNGTPGCGDAGITACVCAQDDYCCTNAWDEVCVALVEEYECGPCDSPSGCGDFSCDEGEHCANCPEDCGWCDGDCCTPNGTPGCDDAGIASCVCGQDDYCCTGEWDEVCVAEVTEFGCSDCGGPGLDCGNDSCDEDEHCANCPVDCGECDGDCCEPNGSPGCADEPTAKCVCSHDEFCCEAQWDEVCAQEVEQFGCGVCDMQPLPDCGNDQCVQPESCVTCPQDCGNCTGSCCQPNGTPGCNVQTTTKCVCELDAYCCEVEWDEVCADLVEDAGCGNCGTYMVDCGDVSCNPGENCVNCPEDCGECSGDCCTPNQSVGCEELDIAQCVCAHDNYCCAFGFWDDVCVAEVEQFGCGHCDGLGEDCGDGECVPPEQCGTCPEDCGDCEGSCCEPNFTPGCDDADVAHCVCAQDAYCCESAWDEVCVEEVIQFECGDCGDVHDCPNGWCDEDENCVSCPDDCGDCSGWGDCCEASGSPGCDDGWVATCVCEEDIFCCDSEWDNICVGEVEEFGCGSCGGQGPGDCGDGECGADEDCTICPLDCGWCPGQGDCCKPNGTVGCKDAVVQECVCAKDAYCCEVDWDYTCAAEVESYGCGDCVGGATCGDGKCMPGESCSSCPEDCGPCAGQGDCCAPHDSPGCEDSSIQACVCKKDSFCCESVWDDVCVAQVTDFGCGACNGLGCGDTKCEGGEDCLTCPEDCGECSGEGCCEPHATAACEDAEIAACVCNEDAYCCQVEWDATCVDEVELFACGDCGGVVVPPECGNNKCEQGEKCSTCPDDCGECPGAGDCCEPGETPGCDNPSIQSCVCQQDDYCCKTKWDQACVDGVEGYDCGVCDGVCEPDCAGKECGGDGCGGNCGQCAENQSCVNGKCKDSGSCQPNCAGKQCGDDGCGGTCGSCPPGSKCHGGQCKQETCTPDCSGKQCGPDGCGSSCGQCPDGFFCVSGHCKNQCKPECHAKQCGPDGCGGICGSCPPGMNCNAQGHCSQGCTPNCAGKQCGDDGCGQSCGTCPPGFTCNDGHCAQGCQANCSGKQCGEDGCGGICGTCPDGYACNAQGHCLSGCLPDCTDKSCGSDGCGGKCGSCGYGQVCNTSFNCEAVCVADCLNKECGADGCGGTCGTCSFGQSCTDHGVCGSCKPDCVGRVCGDDGCGGNCGACPDDLSCDEESGACVYSDLDPEPDEDVKDPQVTVCPPGQELRFGSCVPIEEPPEDLPGSDGGCGCVMDPTHRSTPPLVPALAVLLLAVFALTFRVLRRNLSKSDSAKSYAVRFVRRSRCPRLPEKTG